MKLANRIERKEEQTFHGGEELGKCDASKMKSIHVIVATGEWGQDGLRYRRHRLAEYLQNQTDTENVIWLCPSPHITEDAYSSLPNGIKQVTITDLLPNKLFRFGRYMDLFYRSKLETLLFHLNEAEGEYRIYLWYTFPGFPLLADLFPWEKVIYDCSDLWSSPIDGKDSLISTLRQNIISSAENRIIERAELVFCTSDYLRNHIVGKIGRREHVYTFENGVDYDMFAKQDTKREDALLPELPAGCNRTILGFIGGIKPKLDFILIKAAARQKPEWIFLFVGPDGTNQSQEFQDVLKEENVLWTGSVPSAEVPKYMDLIDIGIMPYKRSPYNQAVFPLKLFEFLAAGKPVVGVHLPSTKSYANNDVYIHIEPEGANEFIHACETFETSKDDIHHQHKRKQIARSRNWSTIFNQMKGKLVQVR